MKKGLAWLFIIIGIAILGLSTSRKAMQYISDKRYWWPGSFGIHRVYGGDLVTMSYLSDTVFLGHANYTFKKPVDTTNKNINLYVWGDSYVVTIPDSAYAHVHQFKVGRRDFTDLNYKLDPHKKNILIIENGERFVRIYFKFYMSLFDHVKKDTTAQLAWFFPGNKPPLYYASMLGGLQITDFFNPNINQNIEYNLFNYNCINGIRGFKAEMNYRLFNRASGDVVLSENGEHLFLRQTVAAHDILSCYEAIQPTEMDRISTAVDSVYQHYKREGFDEVYFSIIPNPATILQPAYYNGLIPALEKRADSMHIPFIDIYEAFSHCPNPSVLYTNGDTHWNNNGCQLWLEAVNKELDKQSKLVK